MKNHPYKLNLGLLVVAILLACLFLAGATNVNGPNQIGRYRLSVIQRGGFADLFVIDTATGIVKYVGKDEGKPFEEIRGH